MSTYKEIPILPATRLPSPQLQQLLVEEAEQLLDLVARVRDLLGELARD